MITPSKCRARPRSRTWSPSSPWVLRWRRARLRRPHLFRPVPCRRRAIPERTDGKPVRSPPPRWRSPPRTRRRWSSCARCSQTRAATRRGSSCGRSWRVSRSRNRARRRRGSRSCSAWTRSPRISGASRSSWSCGERRWRSTRASSPPTTPICWRRSRTSPRRRRSSATWPVRASSSRPCSRRARVCSPPITPISSARSTTSPWRGRSSVIWPARASSSRPCSRRASASSPPTTPISSA